ncbi:hypothetical protein [Streptomyces massasporeus]|uniref:hypothetical protein n=1 Tax=Streptomyces massasporeus TaxID=67324 RepID=UPI00382669E6
MPATAASWRFSVPLPLSLPPLGVVAPAPPGDPAVRQEEVAPIFTGGPQPGLPAGLAHPLI